VPLFKITKIVKSIGTKKTPNQELESALSVVAKWSHIYINKGKNKSKKKIFVPSEDFKQALRIILKDFQKKTTCHKSLYSYQTGLSFTDLAEEHKANEYLLKTDIVHFLTVFLKMMF
jgi:hypothetical protein